MTYTNKCQQCDKDFDSEKPAKYCSTSCRVTAHRSVTAEPQIVTADVTAEPKDFTRKMVEDGDGFIPNWYRLGLNSRNEYKEKAGWNNLMK